MFFFFGIKRSIPAILISLFVPIFKNAANFICSGLINGFPAINSASFFEQISIAISQAALEVLQHILVIAVTASVINQFKKISNVKSKALIKLGTEYNERLGVLPLERFYKKGNPIQSAALRASAVVAVIAVVQRIIYDIFIPIDGWIDVLWMVIYYLSDIVTGFVCYLLILLFIMYFDRISEKLKIKFAE